MCVSVVCAREQLRVCVCAYVGSRPQRATHYMQDVILPSAETSEPSMQQVVVCHTSVLGRGWVVLMRGVVSHVQVGSASTVDDSLEAVLNAPACV